MERAIRVQCFQNLVNYRKPSSMIMKETFPLPPYSTVLGMIHAACGYRSFHPMKLSIQGTNAGTVSELYTRYSFSPGTKYEEGRHQICAEGYGVFRGIAHVELLCENHMVIHILPEEKDFETVYQALCNPPKYLSLGRYEDLLDIERIEAVQLFAKENVEVKRNIYIPVEARCSDGSRLVGNETATIYTLTKEYEITKSGVRRWKRENGRIQVYYLPAGKSLWESYTDDSGDEAAVVFA